MKTYLKNLGITFIGLLFFCAIFYVLTAFNNASFDPFSWEKETRQGLSLLVVIFTFCAFMVAAIMDL